MELRETNSGNSSYEILKRLTKVYSIVEYKSQLIFGNSRS
jgi:hypothetical protein